MSAIRNTSLGLLALLASLTVPPASAQQQKPNILVIMGDDIGYWNISAYNRGMMGYRTPNIDRIAEARYSPTITGSNPVPRPRSIHHRTKSVRTGLLRLACLGRRRLSGRTRLSLNPEAAGLCDRSAEPARRPQRIPAHRARLRRVLGNLYHLNAEDEPEHPD
jgi:arylsulfatase